MEFSFNTEQQQLKDSLDRYLAKNSRFEMRRQQIDTACKARSIQWEAFAEFGLLGIGIAEEFGGMGTTTNVGGDGVAAEDTMLVMESLGRALSVEPYVASVVVAGSALQSAVATTVNDSAKKRCAELLKGIASGSTVVAFAAHERSGRYMLSYVATVAVYNDAKFTLNGRKSVVLHAELADSFIISARTSGAVADQAGISLFIVAKNTPGVTLNSYATNDGAAAAEISLSNVVLGVDALICAEGKAYATIELAVDAGTAALCAEAVGAMSILVDQTLEYLKTRKQFGVVIGSFQALQHKIVDMFIATEQARSMAILAALKINSTDALERRRSIAAAKSLVGQSARLVAQQAVQLHGGMGVTDDLPISHYFRRLTAIDLTYGDAHYHRTQLGNLMVA